MAANRAPFVLQGVPILSCDRCQFFCSDERYLMAHMSVEHGENEKSVPKVAPGEVDDAVKQAIKAPPRRREIESAIESTSKTLRCVLFLDFTYCFSSNSDRSSL